MQKPNLMNRIWVILFGFSLTFSQIEFDVNWTPYLTYYLSMVDINTASGTGMVDMSWLGFKGGILWWIMDDLSLNTQGEFRSKKTGGVNKHTIIARANLEYSF